MPSAQPGETGLPSLNELETRRAQMFPALSERLATRLQSHGEERVFEDGAIVFEQGDVNLPLFLVLEGQLEIVHPHAIVGGGGGGAIPATAANQEHLITIHGAREFTGEVNMLTDRRALVRGRAKGKLRVACVSNATLRTLLQTDSELSDIIMRAFILRRVGLLTAGYGDAIVIGSRDSAATLRLQAFLIRNGHPYRWVDVDHDTEVQSLLDGLKLDVKDIPILICRGEKVLKNPSDAEVAECLGFNPKMDASVVHDVVVCGAGPGGLAAAVYGTSEGLDVVVVESGSPGGQAASSSKIENYLGFPTGISGQALSARALTQAEKFGARIMVARGAKRLHCEETPIRIELANGDSILTRSVVIATGAEYRKLEVENLARFEGIGIYYAATAIESQRCNEDEVIVVGGGNSAGQAATFLARTSKHVHILIRSPDLASSMSRYLIRRIEDTPNITLHRRTRVVALEGSDQHLESVHWHDDATGEVTKTKIRHIFSMAGAVPNTAWLHGCVATDEKGFVYTGTDLAASTLKACKWPLGRAPYLFETNQPRVFAIGDVRANSVKRVASAVGEGSVCIQLVHKAITSE